MYVPALLLTLLTLAELDIVFLDLSVLVCVWFRVEAQEEKGDSSDNDLYSYLVALIIAFSHRECYNSY